MRRGLRTQKQDGSHTDFTARHVTVSEEKVETGTEPSP